MRGRIVRAALTGLVTIFSFLVASPLVYAAESQTAGIPLMKVWTQARRKFPDANFISVSGRTVASGLPVCEPADPFRNGWRYTFYSPSKSKFLMMAECGGSIAGPLIQMRDRNASRLSVEGRFIDSDVALKTLAASGVSLDPADHNVRTRRPFFLTLYRVTDARFETHPAVWKIAIGKKQYLVDASKNELFSPRNYGVKIKGVDISSSAYAAEILGKRPSRASVYTARQDFENVVKYAEKKFKDVRLMGVEGFTDAWGGSPCTGPGDGWAYYFYNVKTRGFEAIYACNGEIGPGPSQYIPVDLNLHEPLPKTFVDSNKIMDGLIVNNPAVMNEGMGRNFTRNASLRLLSYRASPIKRAGMWDIKTIWTVTVGRTQFQFDAKSGSYIGSSQ